MKLTAEQVQEILEAAKPDIIKGLRDEIVAQAKWDLNAEAGKLVRAEVEKFVSAEVVPEVRKQLLEAKDGLIGVAVPLAEQIVATLAASLGEQAKKNLETSYKRAEIVKALLA